MSLNEMLEEALEKKQKTPEKDIILKNYIFLTLGITSTINYLLFIFLGKFIANIIKVNNLVFLSILVATFFNVYIIFRNIKQYNSKKEDK